MAQRTDSLTAWPPAPESELPRTQREVGHGVDLSESGESRPERAAADLAAEDLAATRTVDL